MSDDLKKVGLKFVADDAEKFLRTVQEASGAALNFGTASEKAARSTGELSQAAKAVKLEALNNKIQEQVKALGLLEQELDQTKQRYGEGSIQAQRKQLAIERLSNSINTNKKEFDLLGKEMLATARDSKQFDQITTGALRRVGEKITDFAMNATQQIGAFIGDTIGEAGNFEATLNRFAAVTGDAMADAGMSTKDFSDLFLQMGADTQFSAGQAADAAVELAKGGIEPAAIAGGTLADTLALAAAGELELAAAAEITAKQLGVWSSTGVTSAEVANLLAQAANASTVNVDDLAIGLANVGGVAKVAGLSFEETVQAMAELAPGFSSASDAGTSFKAFLNNLIPTTKPATEAMRELNLLTEDGKSKFYDAAGAFIGMEQAAELLHTATKDLSEAERSLALETIFGSDAQRAAAIIAEGGADAYTKMGVAMDKAGSATDQAAERNKGYNFALESLKGSLETFQITLGMKVLPALTELVNAGIGVVNFFTNAVDSVETFTPLLVALGTAVGVLALTQLPKAISGLKSMADGFLEGKKNALLGSIALSTFSIGIGLLTDEISKHKAEVAALVQQNLDYNFSLQESTQTLGEYRAAEIAVQEALAPQAREIEKLQEELRKLEAVRAQANLADFKGGLELSEEAAAELDATIARLNGELEAKSTSLAANVKGLQDHSDAVVNINPQLAGFTSFVSDATGAISGMHAMTGLSKERLTELSKELQTITADGIEALRNSVNTQFEFMTGLEERTTTHTATLAELNQAYRDAETEAERAAIATQIEEENASYATQQQQAAANYAQLMAQQQAFLGEQLINWVNNQVAMGNISAEKADELNETIAREYGVAADSTALLFGQMTGSILEWGRNGEQSAADFVAGLMATQDAAVETRQRQDELAGQLEREVTAAFEAGKLTAQEYERALRGIPAKVNTMLEIEQRVKVITEYYEERKQEKIDSQLYTGTKYWGGGLTWAGERGPELAILPDGTMGVLDFGVYNLPRGTEVVPAHATDDLMRPFPMVQPPATPAQMSAAAATYNTSTSNTYNYQPTYSSAPMLPSQDFAMMRARSARGA